MKQRPTKIIGKTAPTPIFEVVEPRASALIESLRAFGYNLRTAVADIVDNSISAGAKNVCLRTYWSGSDSFLALIDDGRGMSATELVNAMRPGSKSPTEEREADDLGRFGLGLKTASFSQCRRLTVWSKRESGRAAVPCWDLDYVCESSEWRLLHTVEDSTKQILNSLTKPSHGTIVLWEKMDRLWRGIKHVFRLSTPTPTSPPRPGSANVCHRGRGLGLARSGKVVRPGRRRAS